VTVARPWSDASEPLAAEQAAEDESRWLDLSTASTITGVPVSSLRRWARRGRVTTRRGSEGSGANLVALEEVLLARASQIGRNAAVDDPVFDQLLPDAWHRAVAMLCAVAHERGREAAVERLRADMAAHEVVALRQRVAELESWIEERAKYEDVEQLQLGRLLAHASNEREGRLQPFIVSPRLLGTIIYAAAMVVLVWVLLTGRG